jgi:hypothetical protein
MPHYTNGWILHHFNVISSSSIASIKELCMLISIVLRLFDLNFVAVGLI